MKPNSRRQFLKASALAAVLAPAASIPVALASEDAELFRLCEQVAAAQAEALSAADDIGTEWNDCRGVQAAIARWKSLSEQIKTTPAHTLEGAFVKLRQTVPHRGADSAAIEQIITEIKRITGRA